MLKDINKIRRSLYHEDFIKIFKKLIRKKGVFNVGGPTNSVYNFAKIKKSFGKKSIKVLALSPSSLDSRCLE